MFQTFSNMFNIICDPGANFLFQILFHISHNYVTKWAELFKQNIFHIFLCKSDSLSYHYVLTFGLKNLNVQYIKIH